MRHNINDTLIMWTYLYPSEHCALRRNCTNVYCMFSIEGAADELVAVVLIMFYVTKGERNSKHREN